MTIPHRAHPRWRETIWLLPLAALVGLGGWSGHALGAARRTAAGAPDHQNGATLPDGEKKEHRSDKASALSQDRLDAALKRLQALCRDTPYAAFDPEWQAAVDRILSGLSAEELAQINARLDPAGDENEEAFTIEVRRYWAAKDPDAALAAAFQVGASSGRYSFYETFQEWSSDQPEQALEWSHTGKFPPGLEDRANWVRQIALDRLAGRDFTAAVAEYQKLSPAEASRVLSGWARAQGGDPEMREKLIALAGQAGGPGGENLGGFYSSLMISWGRKDTAASQAYLDDAGQNMPPETRASADAGLAFAMSGVNTQSAMSWWLDHHTEDATAPSTILSSIGYWTRSAPDQALQWLNGQPESPQRDAVSAAVISGLAARFSFPAAATVLQNITDPDMRQDTAQRLDLLWSATDPQRAAAWRATRSAVDPAPAAGH